MSLSACEGDENVSRLDDCDLSFGDQPRRLAGATFSVGIKIGGWTRKMLFSRFAVDFSKALIFFDARLFDLASVESLVMDPQQRVLLECAYAIQKCWAFDERTGRRRRTDCFSLQVRCFEQILGNVPSEHGDG
jgi:hypothetical protein